YLRSDSPEPHGEHRRLFVALASVKIADGANSRGVPGEGGHHRCSRARVADAEAAGSASRDDQGSAVGKGLPGYREMLPFERFGRHRFEPASADIHKAVE